MVISFSIVPAPDPGNILSLVWASHLAGWPGFSSLRRMMLASERSGATTMRQLYLH